MSACKGRGNNMRKGIGIFMAFCILLSLFSWTALAESTVTIPEMTIVQKEVPDNEAMEFLKNLGVGWNLGNTFDAIKQGWNKNADEMTLETVWCGVATSEKMFDALKEAGFTAVRIPVSWHDHVSGPDHEISERWMSRVQEVVDWAMERGFYVILNTHHDEDQFEPSAKHFEESAHYIECVWRQIGERFMDYDEHLILESMNEPRLMNSNYEWWFDANAPECQDAADCLNKLNQLFVDTVRATGGTNASRYLMVPGYDASPENAVRDSFILPADTADNKIIVSVHAYTPYAFALQMPGTSEFGAQNQKMDIVNFMNSLYNKYIANGIPVVIGEFGAMEKNGNRQARLDWTAYYVNMASARNLPVLWWDNNAFSGNGELFGLLNRKDCSFPFPELAEVIVRYGGYNKLPAAN